MQLEVRTLAIGKKSWATSIVESFQKKIGFFQSIDFKQIKNEKDLLKGVADKDWVVLCDERGATPSSREFAGVFQKDLESGKSRMVFIVGGPFGAIDDVKKRADRTLSLSHFVFNQELALVVLFEQLFRAFSINNNHPYHND